LAVRDQSVNPLVKFCGGSGYSDSSTASTLVRLLGGCSPLNSATSRSSSSTRLSSAFSRFCDCCSQCRNCVSESRGSISACGATHCSYCRTVPWYRSLMTSSSLTRVLRAVLAWSRPSYDWGASRWRSVADEMEPGEGWRRWTEGGWKVWSERVTPSNTCWGAMFEGWWAGVSVWERGELEPLEPSAEVLWGRVRIGMLEARCLGSRTVGC